MKTEIWADEVDVPRTAGGSFRATLWTVWRKTGAGWRRMGATLDPARRDQLASATADEPATGAPA